MRTKLDNITRVMWYLRPVSHYNLWKKSEFKERVCYEMETSINSKFIAKYK